MNKYKKIFAVFLIVTLTLTGCSLSDFDASLRKEIGNLQPAASIEPNVALPNESVPNEINNESSENKHNGVSHNSEIAENKVYYTVQGKSGFAFTVKGIGETYAELMSYVSNKDEERKNGQEGIYYTLESVEVYDFFNDSGLDETGIYVNNDILIKSNSFIVAELTAHYIAPENGKSEITLSPYLIPDYFEEKSDELLLSRISEKILSLYLFGIVIYLLKITQSLIKIKREQVL